MSFCRLRPSTLALWTLSHLSRYFSWEEITHSQPKRIHNETPTSHICILSFTRDQFPYFTHGRKTNRAGPECFLKLNNTCFAVNSSLYFLLQTMEMRYEDFPWQYRQDDAFWLLVSFWDTADVLKCTTPLTTALRQWEWAKKIYSAICYIPKRHPCDRRPQAAGPQMQIWTFGCFYFQRCRGKNGTHEFLDGKSAKEQSK